MRQWCADRYEHYPVMPEDMNEYITNDTLTGQRSRAFTMVDGDDIVGTSPCVLRQTTRQSNGWICHCR